MTIAAEETFTTRGIPTAPRGELRREAGSQPTEDRLVEKQDSRPGRQRRNPREGKFLRQAAEKSFTRSRHARSMESGRKWLLTRNMYDETRLVRRLSFRRISLRQALFSPRDIVLSSQTTRPFSLSFLMVEHGQHCTSHAHGLSVDQSKGINIKFINPLLLHGVSHHQSISLACLPVLTPSIIHHPLAYLSIATNPPFTSPTHPQFLSLLLVAVAVAVRGSSSASASASAPASPCSLRSISFCAAIWLSFPR